MCSLLSPAAPPSPACLWYAVHFFHSVFLRTTAGLTFVLLYKTQDQMLKRS